MATIIDVANRAGVSVGTVSNVINNTAKVSEKKRLKVIAAIKELDFSPSESARNLKQGKTNTLALFIPKISIPFFSLLIEGVEKGTSLSKFELMIYKTRGKEGIEDKLLRLLAEKKVDGAIVVSTSLSKKTIEKIKINKYSVVLIDRLSGIKEIPSLTIDNELGGFIATEYLINLGHKEIALINGSKETISGSQRFDGFIGALEKYKLEFNSEYYFEGSFDFETGYKGVKFMMDNLKRPTAIFAACDTIAMGAVSCLYKQGCKVPDDVSVIGYDDIRFASFMSPTLTTVKQPIFKIGKEAVDVLINIINDGIRIKSPRIYDIEIVVRDSCR